MIWELESTFANCLIPVPNRLPMPAAIISSVVFICSSYVVKMLIFSMGKALFPHYFRIISITCLEVVKSNQYQLGDFTELKQEIILILSLEDHLEAYLETTQSIISLSISDENFLANSISDFSNSSLSFFLKT